MDAHELQQCKDPIDQENLCGVNLRDDQQPDSLYYTIKDARNLARQIERQHFDDQEQCELATLHWQTVQTECIKALSLHTKDLELLSWLCEAMLRINNLEGLHQTFDLSFQLMTGYWDDLYPLPEEGDLEYRFSAWSALSGVNSQGSLIVPLKQMLITNSSGDSQIALWEFESAVINDKNDHDKYGDALNVIYKQIEETSVEFYENLKNNLTQCICKYMEINDFLLTICQDQLPSSRQLSDIFEDILVHINDMLVRSQNYHGLFKKQLDDNIVLKDDQSTEEKNPNTKHGRKSIFDRKNKKNLDSTKLLADKKTNSAQGLDMNNMSVNKVLDNVIIDDRSTALNLLDSIIDYYHFHEPHSPIPYILGRAKRWAELSFQELLTEMIDDEKEKKSLHKLTDIHI